MSLEEGQRTGEMKFNINEYVWVKLNDKGREIYLRSFDCIPLEFRRVHLPETDSDGYSRFQMWSFMQIFGSHIGTGFDPPFDTTIKFDPKDLKD
jgi:hypothetical protein